jgi:hypothetical protein
MDRLNKIIHVKAFLMCVLYLVIFHAANGQQDGFSASFRVGITAGATVSTGSYQYGDGPEPPSFNPLVFPGGGLTLDWRTSRRFSLQNSLLYKSKGDRIDMKTWTEEFYHSLASFTDPAITVKGEGTIMHDIRYLEWTISANMIVSRVFEAGVGLFAAAGLSGMETEDYAINYLFSGIEFRTDEVNNERPVEFVSVLQTDEASDTLYFNRFDYGLAGRVGFRTGPLTWAVSLNYSFGNWEPAQYDLFGTRESLNQTRHISGMVSLSYLFGKRD